jgi:serine protease Do
MKKWGGTPNSAKSFSQLLKEKVAAKDPEALKLMAEAKKNGGKLKMTKNQQAELMKKWGGTPNSAQTKPNQKSFSFKNSDIKPELMKELKKYGKIGPDGKFKIEMTPQNAKELKPLLEKLGLKKQAMTAMNKVGQEKNGKGAKTLLEKFKKRTVDHAAYTAQILKDGKQVALGTVITADGYIITKSSEVIFGEISCKVGEETYEAKVLRSDNIYDVALIKVEAEELTAVQWNTDIAPAQRGTWLLSPNYNGEAAAIGILSHEPRTIRRKSATVISNTNKVFLGVVLDHQENIPNVLQVVEGGAAKEAGILKGDRILAINGAEMKTSTQVVEELGKFKVDDTIKLKVLRSEKEVVLESKLKPRNVKSNNLRKDALEKLSLKGGTISKRNSAFPLAITHDSIIQANQCGGLLVNLKGEIIGMNIARANRTATYAIPISVVEEIIEGLIH